MPKTAHKRTRNIAKYKGAAKGLSRNRNRSNSTKPTDGDCIPDLGTQGIVKLEALPFQSSAITSDVVEENREELEELISASVIKKPSCHKNIPKGFQQLARFWLGRTRDAARERQLVGEKFELEGVGSTIDSSLFDDPPYEKDEISSSALLSSSQESKSDPSILEAPYARQDNALIYDSGTSKEGFTQQNGETGGNDEVMGMRLCGLCSRRLKVNIQKQLVTKMSQVIPKQANGTLRITENIGDANLQKVLHVESLANQGKTSSIAEDPLKATDDEENVHKSADSFINPPGAPSVHSYSSGPESEGLQVRLKGLDLTGFADADEVNEWSVFGTQAEKKKEIDSRSESRTSLGKLTDRAPPIAMAKQSNCCNAHRHSIISIKQPCIPGNEVIHQGAYEHFLNTTASSSKNSVYDKACILENRMETISGLSKFFDEDPCVDEMRNKNIPTEPRSVSQRDYRIAKIGVNESTSSYGAFEDAETTVCVDQANNNAVNETKPIEFALPGPVKKPTPFLSLIKEARAANMVPPSLPIPSYSWEKKEVPEQDCMILPARKPKEGVEETSSQPELGTQSPKQVNQSGAGNQTPAPSLHSIIEAMQKVKAAEAELKSKREIERARKMGGEMSKAMTASQAMKSAKGAAAVDYKERRRLRQEKEIEEARKELVEAAKSALKDRIEYNERERKSAFNSIKLSTTLFCGSTNAMFDPDAPLGETEESLEYVEKSESPSLTQPPEEETKDTNSLPQPSHSSNPSLKSDNNEAESVVKSAIITVKAPTESVGKTTTKTKKKIKRKCRKNQNKTLNSATPLLCGNPQVVPEKQKAFVPQTVPICTMPQPMFVPVPVGVPTCGLLPYFERQQNQSWNSMECRCGRRHSSYKSETSSNSASRSCKPRRKKMLRKRLRPCKKSSSFSSFSSFSDIASFNSGSTFSPSLCSSSRTLSSSSLSSCLEEECTSDTTTTSVTSEATSMRSVSSCSATSSLTESSSCEDWC